MSPNYDKFNYCKYCGVFLGEFFKEDHWCPEQDDEPRRTAKDEDKVEELNFDREDTDDV